MNKHDSKLLTCVLIIQGYQVCWVISCKFLQIIYHETLLNQTGSVEIVLINTFLS